MEDLWAFNERIVAEAIVRCSLPIVAAIGHETDTTIAELVADERAATPTQAAMRIAPDCGALTEQVTAFASRLSSALSRHVRHDRDRLRAAARHPFFMDPSVVVQARRERLDVASQRLAGAIDRRVRIARQRVLETSARLERNRPAEVHARRSAALSRAEALLHAAWAGSLRRRIDRIDAVERALELVGPQAVLARGFSVTLRGDGSALTRAEQALPGEQITTVLADGKVSSVV
jgi:exodeoxyribonuclease VII large subunit